jgi:hypothetical protein
MSETWEPTEAQRTLTPGDKANYLGTDGRGCEVTVTVAPWHSPEDGWRLCLCFPSGVESNLSLQCVTPLPAAPSAEPEPTEEASFEDAERHAELLAEMERLRDWQENVLAALGPCPEGVDTAEEHIELLQRQRNDARDREAKYVDECHALQGRLATARARNFGMVTAVLNRAVRAEVELERLKGGADGK